MRKWAGWLDVCRRRRRAYHTTSHTVAASGYAPSPGHAPDAARRRRPHPHGEIHAPAAFNQPPACAASRVPKHTTTPAYFPVSSRSFATSCTGCFRLTFPRRAVAASKCLPLSYRSLLTPLRPSSTLRRTEPTPDAHRGPPTPPPLSPFPVVCFAQLWAFLSVLRVHARVPPRPAGGEGVMLDATGRPLCAHRTPAARSRGCSVTSRRPSTEIPGHTPDTHRSRVVKKKGRRHS